MRACVIKPKRLCTFPHVSDRQFLTHQLKPIWQQYILSGFELTIERIPETLRAALVKEKFVDDRFGFHHGKPTWLSSANGELSIIKALS